MGLAGFDHDRREPPEGGGLSRFMTGGEDIASWSVGLYRLGTIRVRAHWFWLIGLIIALVLSVPLSEIGPIHIVMSLGWGVILVFAREHTRHMVSGGRGAFTGEQLAILWDYGRINLSDLDTPPPRPIADAIGGTLFNFAMLPISVGLVLAAGGGTRHLVFDPSDLKTAVADVTSPLLGAVWWLYWTNLFMLGVNLLPLLPMDAARLWIALRQERHGREETLGRIAKAGLWVAGITLVAALATGITKLFGVAIVGGLLSYLQVQRGRFLGLTGGGRIAAGGGESWESNDVIRENRRIAEEERNQRLRNRNKSTPPRRASDGAAGSPLGTGPNGDDQAVIDRILAKISKGGMAALTDEERATLEAATRRRRDAR